MGALDVRYAPPDRDAELAQPKSIPSTSRARFVYDSEPMANR